MINYNVTPSCITGFFNGKTFVLLREHKWFAQVLKAVKENDVKILDNLLNAADAYREVAKKIKAKVIASTTVDLVSWDGEDLFYNGKKITGAIEEKFKDAIANDASADMLVAFLNKCYLNPSQIATSEMFDFLNYKELPLTPDGDILAYKGIDDDFYSHTANKDPNFKLISGKIDSRQKIFNGVGEVIEIERNLVDPNRRNECSHGLHVGSYDYAKSFSQKLVVVKVNPADCIAVPLDHSCQKMRVSRYEVVSEVSK